MHPQLLPGGDNCTHVGLMQVKSTEGKTLRSCVMSTNAKGTAVIDCNCYSDVPRSHVRVANHQQKTHVTPITNLVGLVNDH